MAATRAADHRLSVQPGAGRWAERLRRAALVIVALHALVAGLHGLAHLRLEVGLSTWQAAYVGGVIGALPLLAAVGLLRCHPSGYALLALSMLGSLGFGVYYHFLVPGPDHVAMLPASPWASVFAVTAGLLALSETAGAVIGWLGGRLSRGCLYW